MFVGAYSLSSSLIANMAPQKWIFQIYGLLPIFQIISGTNIHGMNLRVGVHNQLPAMGDVLAILSNALNFSTTLVYDPYGSGSGVYNETTGEWNGLIGLIYRNEADFALGKFCHHVLYTGWLRQEMEEK